MSNLMRNKIAPVIQTVKAINNPMTLFNQVPGYKEMVDFVNANGGNAEALFYKRAKEMGIDPEDVLSQLR